MSWLRPAIAIPATPASRRLIDFPAPSPSHTWVERVDGETCRSENRDPERISRRRSASISNDVAAYLLVISGISFLLRGHSLDVKSLDLEVCEHNSPDIS